jgi:hypothetical protein
MEHLFLMFLDHTRRRNTVGRTPLDEWSARRRDLYLTTHDTHNRQMSMTPVGFEPTISAGERPVADHSSRGVLPTVLHHCVWSRNIKNRRSIYIYDISSLRVNTLAQRRLQTLIACSGASHCLAWWRKQYIEWREGRCAVWKGGCCHVGVPTYL